MKPEEMLHDAPRPAARQPKSGEQIWSLRKNGRQNDCELRFHGESYGWEVQWLHDGVLAYGQRYVLKDGALREAEAQRAHLMSDGWIRGSAM